MHAGMDAWMMDAWMRGAGQCLVRRRQGRRKRKALGEALQCLLCPSLNNHCEWDPVQAQLYRTEPSGPSGPFAPNNVHARKGVYVVQSLASLMDAQTAQDDHAAYYTSLAALLAILSLTASQIHVSTTALPRRPEAAAPGFLLGPAAPAAEPLPPPVAAVVLSCT